jgi:hypothetical protein
MSHGLATFLAMRMGLLTPVYVQFFVSSDHSSLTPSSGSLIKTYISWDKGSQTNMPWSLLEGVNKNRHPRWFYLVDNIY